MTTQQCKCGFQAENNFCSECGEKLKPDIFKLVKEKKHEKLRQALEEHSYDLTATHRGYDTVLQIAARKNRKECLRVLLEYDVDINIRESGYTPVNLAAVYNRPTCLQMLLDHGADPDIMNVVGNTALTSALADRDVSRKILKILLEHNVDPNVKNKEGQSPLDRALHWGYEDCIKLLLEHGAKVTFEIEGEYPQFKHLWSNQSS